mmetsp:Transcript_128701/g.223189  ORF Transcript_128701/g.223189 Transcript_128701/m.223189 type:complete len:874 (+) Transcript_128701:153-2774(+)
MSKDRATLRALEVKTKAELRYFELVVLRFAGESHQCFLCVGKHALFFVRRNVTSLYPDDEGGRIYYAHVDRLVEDATGTTDMLLVMTENRGASWVSENIFIVSETRKRLCDQLKIAWQTCHTWRFGEVRRLPCTTHPLRSKPQPGTLYVEPFKGFARVERDGYSFFTRKALKEDVVASLQAGSLAIFKSEEHGLELSVDIHEPVPLIQLAKDGRDHIRWVAMDYKTWMSDQLNQVVVLRDAFYVKKMNLANDVASWTAWEVFLKSEYYALVTILLRRQYVPPMLDAAQDMAVSMRCPTLLLNEGKISDRELLAEARLVADSMAPLGKNCTAQPTLCRDVIQEKLDALLFSEEGMRWVENMLGLRPKWEVNARSFIRSILKILQDMNALNKPDLINDIDAGSDQLSISHDPMSEVGKLRFVAENNFADDETLNAWEMRVSKYFAYCLDGGLLGCDFTLSDICADITFTHLSEQRMKQVIHFLLHIRPTDMAQKYKREGMTVPELLYVPTPNFGDYTFNDRVMHSLIELRWIERCFPQLQEEDGDTRMSTEYARFLARMLMSKVSSTSLKVSVCRQIIAGYQKHPDYDSLIPALIHCMGHGNLHLTTYAIVTVINMSEGRDLVKDMMIQRGVAPLCVEQLRSTDDALTQYTLVLLANLAKSNHHREAIIKCGIVEVLNSLLLKCCSKTDKRKVLVELANVIGQLCNDEDVRQSMRLPEINTVQYLMKTLEMSGSPGENLKLKSKLLFALKQLCITSRKDADGAKGHRQNVGKKVIQLVMEELTKLAAVSEKTINQLHVDFVFSAVMFLRTLAVDLANCNLMKDSKSMETSKNITILMDQLVRSTFWKVPDIRDRFIQLEKRVTDAKLEYALDDET